MLTRKVGLFVVLAILVAAGSFGLIYLGCKWQDAFPSAFTVARFRELKPGDSYEKVIGSLGYPWSYVVPGIRRTVLPEMTNLVDLTEYCSTNDYGVILQYWRVEGFTQRDPVQGRRNTRSALG